MIQNFEPPCVKYAIENGPLPDDSMAWVITLAKWIKKEGTPEETAPLRIVRWYNASDSGEELDDEEILMHCKAAWKSDLEISCNEMMACRSFNPGCIGDKCPLHVQPVVPLGGPTARRVYLTDPPGTVGIGEEGQVGIIKEIIKKDGSSFQVLQWISDCAVYIHTETLAGPEREFIFEGVGAVDKKKIRFSMIAPDLADHKKFKAELINAFGAANRVGELNFEMVQRITANTIKRRRLCSPMWVDGKPIVPGAGLADDIEFKMLEMIPAEVHDGDLDAAKKTLEKLLDIPGPTMILVTAILGSPIYARWFLNDRFGVGMWGRTGSLKTSVSKKAMCVYGAGYNDDANLLKHGKSGSTAVGQLEILAGAGILPEIVDNVKSVDPRDAQQYISMVHAVIEGKDKVRGKKDGGVRASKPFLCTLIVTGEIKPDEASTSARILNLKWAEPSDKTEIDFVQANINQLPVIGYHWLRFLATLADPRDGFDEVRSIKTNEFNASNYVNSGRLATIYALLRATWNLLCRSPLSDVFEARTKRFLNDLDSACAEQGRMVSEETEVAKFMRGVASVIAAQPHLIQPHERQLPDEYGKTYRQEVIGRWMEDGNLFLIPDQTLKVLKTLGVFSQIPTIGSITDALAQSGLIIEKDGRKRIQQRVNDARPRGWLIPKDKLPLDEATDGDDENDNKRPNVTKSPLSQQKTNKSFDQALENSEKKNDENIGDSGDVVIDIDKKKEVDSDKLINILSPSLSPNVSNNSNKPIDTSTNNDKIRIAARQEFGLHGSVDHRIVAGKLKLPEEEVKAWFETNYKRLESGRYTQK